MISFIGAVQTHLAGSYLTRLCKHLSNSIRIEYADNEAYAHFEFGDCHLVSEAQTLTFHCETEDLAALARMQSTIEQYVQIFARHNPVKVTWQPHLESNQS
jgi:hypothetical protein